MGDRRCTPYSGARLLEGTAHIFACKEIAMLDTSLGYPELEELDGTSVRSSARDGTYTRYSPRSYPLASPRTSNLKEMRANLRSDFYFSSLFEIFKICISERSSACGVKTARTRFNRKSLRIQFNPKTFRDAVVKRHEVRFLWKSDCYIMLCI